MPLIMGILAQAAGAPTPPAAVDAYDLLETEILTGTQASVTFSSLNSTYGADYQHLQIRYTARDTGAYDSASINVQLNGITTASYAWHSLRTLLPTTVQSTGASSATFATMSLFPGNNATSGNFGAGVIDILDPFETKNTTMRAFFGHTVTDARIGLNSGLFNNTAAITSINLATNGSGLAANSRFSLYGWKAA